MSPTQRAGRYRLLRVIGEGGMGVVHLGLDPSDRAVAVKVVRPHVAADPQTRARLAREVRSLVKVRHPRVAEVLDADFDADLPYVVMRYVPGEALDAVVRRDGPLVGEQLDELAVGLFEAVSAIHSVGVVHRDLKPGNVLLLDGSPVVIDFGIARALDDASLTSTGLMVGTPGYLSPEVLDGTDVGTAADWWGWGAVMAFAATGRPPFRLGPMEAVWDRVRRGAVDLQGVQPDLARVLAATLRPEPGDRPSPADLADGIEHLTGRRPAAVAASTRLGANAVGAAARAGAAGAAAVSGAAGAAAGAGATRVHQPHEERPHDDGATRQDRRPEQRPAAPVTRVVERPPPAAPVRARTGAVETTQALAPLGRPAGVPAPTGRWQAPGRGAQDHRGPGQASAVPVAAAALARAPSGYGPADPRPPVQPSRPAGGAEGGPLPRRPLLALLGYAVLVAVAVVTPVGAAVLSLVWVSVARAAQWSRVAAARTRWRSGRLGAGARTGLTLMYPFRLVGAALASVGHLLLSLMIVSPLLLLTLYLLLRGMSWSSWTTVSAVLTDPPVLTGALAVAVLLAWFGPGGRALRQGSRALSEPVARTSAGRAALLGLAGLVVVAAVLVALTGR